MRDADCVAFLKAALPQLRLRWEGFRRVRGQVCKRLARRLAALGLADLRAYRGYLGAHREEWGALDGLCRVTISRFGRDRAVLEGLRRQVLPELARCALRRRAPLLRAWSAGCASGEEVYTLALAWSLDVGPRYAPLALEVLGTDADAFLIERARRGCYARGTLRELPPDWLAAFEPRGRGWCLRAEHRTGITFAVHDVRSKPPEGSFDLVLCRNLAFTYFEEDLQAEVLAELVGRLVPGGALVVGVHETPPATAALEAWPELRAVYRRR